jgi:hypothetical protein
MQRDQIPHDSLDRTGCHQRLVQSDFRASEQASSDLLLSLVGPATEGDELNMPRLEDE